MFNMVNRTRMEHKIGNNKKKEHNFQKHIRIRLPSSYIESGIVNHYSTGIRVIKIMQEIPNKSLLTLHIRACVPWSHASMHFTHTYAPMLEIETNTVFNETSLYQNLLFLLLNIPFCLYFFCVLFWSVILSRIIIHYIKPEFNLFRMKWKKKNCQQPNCSKRRQKKNKYNINWKTKE